MRLADLAGDADPIDLLLAELEAAGPDGTGTHDPTQLELFGTLRTELAAMHKQPRAEVHRVRTRDGLTYIGTWEEIVAEMRDNDDAFSGRPIREFLEEAAARASALTGIKVPATDAESFIRGSADAGLLQDHEVKRLDPPEAAPPAPSPVRGARRLNDRPWSWSPEGR